MSYTRPDDDAAPVQLETPQVVTTGTDSPAWPFGGDRFYGPTEPLELIAAPLEVKWPPFHILGAGAYMDTIEFWCSCGWKGGTVTVPDDESDAGAIETIARSWRAHCRLTNRIIRADKRLHAHPEHQDPGYSE